MQTNKRPWTVINWPQGGHGRWTYRFRRTRIKNACHRLPAVHISGPRAHKILSSGPKHIALASSALSSTRPAMSTCHCSWITSRAYFLPSPIGTSPTGWTPLLTSLVRCFKISNRSLTNYNLKYHKLFTMKSELEKSDAPQHRKRRCET